MEIKFRDFVCLTQGDTITVKTDLKHNPEFKFDIVELKPNSQFKTVSRAAGVVATPHTLRHTAATILIDRGVPLAEVSRFLRHSDLGTTQIYADIRGVTCKSVAAAFKLTP